MHLPSRRPGANNHCFENGRGGDNSHTQNKTNKISATGVGEQQRPKEARDKETRGPYDTHTIALRYAKEKRKSDDEKEETNNFQLWFSKFV